MGRGSKLRSGTRPARSGTEPSPARTSSHLLHFALALALAYPKRLTEAGFMHFMQFMHFWDPRYATEQCDMISYFVDLLYEFGTIKLVH